MLYPAELRACGKQIILAYAPSRSASMPRNPFSWEIRVRREVLDDEMIRLRQIPYALWQDVVTTPISKLVTARDDKVYRLRVTAAYTMDGTEDIRVTMSLARTTLLRRGLIRQTFIITRENTIRV